MTDRDDETKRAVQEEGLRSPASNDPELSKHQQAERLLAEQLIGGDPDHAAAEAEAVRKLPPKWEIRIQTEHDPVAEETKKYRSLAKEVDDRYDDRGSPGSAK